MMQYDWTRVTGVGTLLTLGVLAACDSGPTDAPPFDPAGAAVAFAQLGPAAAGEAEESTGAVAAEAPCPAGGTITVEGSVSSEQDGDLTIRRTERTTRYEDCGMVRGSRVVKANGALAYSGESHLEDAQARWPTGVLFQKGRQTGTLTMEHGDGDVRTCEYDVEVLSKPAVGYFSFKGVACGVPIDFEGTL